MDKVPTSRSGGAAPQADLHPELDREFAAKVLAPLQHSLALAPPNLVLSPATVPAMSPSFASIISSLSPAPAPSQPPSSFATPRQNNGNRLPSIAAKAGASVLSPPMSARHGVAIASSLTSPPLSARNHLISPRLELQQEPYVVYDNVQMVSDLETKLVMVYYPAYFTLEVVCVVQGVQEGNTLRLYLDYRMIYAALLQSDFVSRAKKRRRQLALDFLLPRLKIVRGVDAWSLSLDNPKERRYRRFDGSLSMKCSVASKKIDDNSISNRSTTRRMFANSDESTKGEDEEMLLHRKEKELDEKLLKELNKLIRDKPPQIPPLDIQAYFTTKEERGLQFLDHFIDLPLLHSSVLKFCNPVTNFLGRAWMCGDDIDGLLEAYWTIENGGPNLSAQSGSRRNSHRIAHNGSTSGELLLNEGETFATTNILLETMESKKNSTDSRTKLPKIDFSSSSADSRSSSVAATSSSSSLSSTLLNLLHPKKNAGGEKHVYDFFASGSGSAASGEHASPPQKLSNAHTSSLGNKQNSPEKDPKNRFRIFGGNMFRRSPDAHEDLGLVPSDMASSSFDLAKSESGSGKSGRSRRRTLNSTDPSMDNIPRTSVRYRYGTNSLAALSIDERAPALHGTNNSTHVTPTARDRTQRRTFGMDPLSGHFATPGGSALAAAAMGLPFSSGKKPLETPTSTK